jgi:hypothetical protein
MGVDLVATLVVVVLPDVVVTMVLLDPIVGMALVIVVKTVHVGIVALL